MIISMCLTPLVATLVQVSPMGSWNDVNHVVFRHVFLERRDEISHVPLLFEYVYPLVN